MRGAGHSSHNPNPVAREVFEEHVRGLREISQEEMSVVFDLKDIQHINEYQFATDIGRLALKPIPDEFTQKYGRKTDMLIDNTMSYDEEGEDLLFEDSLILNIVDARRGTNNSEMTELFRVRRSVVAFILFHWNSIDKGQRLRDSA